MSLRRLLVLVVSLLLLAHAAGTCRAGLGPENVAVVVNADSWASLTAANAFIANRGIPPGNVIYLEDVPGYEHVGVDEFRDKLLKPVLKTIEERGLTPQIDCIAWSSDFPYGIEVQSDVAASGRKLPQVLTPVASINGLTYLYELVLAKDTRYLDLDANWYYRRPFRADGKGGKAGPPKRRMDVSDEERTKFREAMKLIADKKWAEASPILAELAKNHPDETQLHYNLACCLAREGKADEAMAALKGAVDSGWFDREHAEKDEDLKDLRDRQVFKDLAAKMVPPLFDVQPTTGFRSSYRWNEQGERVETGGRRYMLSVMLAVTSGRGVSLAQAVDGLRNSMRGDGLLPRGTIYFVKNGDVRSRTREWAFQSAVAKLKSLDVKAEIVEGVLPQNEDDVAGVMIGAADFDWPGSKSRITPGAIVEHLTSFGGVLREHSGQTPLTALLKHGAAGASGTVTEPYAIQAKFPTAFLHVHYAAGARLAEAFYQSVQGPYQLLIVGDPMCRLWGKLRGLNLDIPKPPERAGGMLVINPAVSPSLDDFDDKGGEKPIPVDHFELSIDGRPVLTAPPGKPLEFDTGKLSEGWHEYGVGFLLRGPLEEKWQSHAGHSFSVGRTDRVALDISGLLTRDEDPLERDNPFGPRHEGIPADQQLSVRVGGADAKSTGILQGLRTLQQFEKGEGSVEVSPVRLGQGWVSLRAVVNVDGTIVSSRPRLFEVEAPVKALAAPVKPEKPLAEGMLLKITGREKPVEVADTRSSQWLSDLKLPPGSEFLLDAWFESTADLKFGSQFQIAGNCRAKLEIDGVPQRAVRDSAWQYIPAWLNPGWHRLSVAGHIPEDPKVSPQLILRYGGEGTQSLDGKRFRHTAE